MFHDRLAIFVSNYVGKAKKNNLGNASPEATFPLGYPIQASADVHKDNLAPLSFTAGTLKLGSELAFTCPRMSCVWLSDYV
jgi:hypothetical protein